MEARRIPRLHGLWFYTPVNGRFPAGKRGDMEKLRVLYRNRLLALVSALALTLACMLASPASNVRAESLSDLEKELNALRQEEAEILKELKAARKDADSQKAYQDSLDKQIENTVRQIELQDEKINRLDTQLLEKNAALAVREQAADEKRADRQERINELGERLRRLDKGGNLSALQVIFDSGDYVGYLYRSKLMENIASEDRKLMDALEGEIRALQQEMDAIDADKQALASQRKELETLRGTAEQKKLELDALYKEARRVLQKLDQDAESLRRQQEKLERQQKELDDRIASIKYGDGKYTDGSMHWPVPVVKYIFRGFQTKNGKITHKGLDISSHPTIPIFGKDIVAAADGEVIYENHTDTRPGKSKGGGYGYYIIIDHGKNSKGVNIRTLYAHCSAIEVRVGDKVVGGQTVIGKAGTTGDSTGPHVHFEVRENNQPVDPIQKGYVSMK